MSGGYRAWNYIKFVFLCFYILIRLPVRRRLQLKFVKTENYEYFSMQA